MTYPGYSFFVQEDTVDKLKTLKSYRPVFIFCILFSCIVFYLLLSNGLVNSEDGLWEYDYYKAGKWTLSLGRWFSLYLDRLRFGVSTEPITSLLTLVCYSAGLVIMLHLFRMKGQGVISCLVCALFLGSVSVCSSLSFRFLSPNFGVAFLFDVAAAWLIIHCKKAWQAIGAGGILIAFAMGLYQAYIGCTCIVLLGYFLISLHENEKELKEILRWIAKGFGAAILGGGLYTLILNIHLGFFHLDMSSYNGADGYSLMNTIKTLPSSIPSTYRVFHRYFFEASSKLNVLQGAKIYLAVFLVALIFLGMGFWQILKRNKPKAILFAVSALLVPLACNAVLLIATESWTSLHMTLPMALCIPVLLCVETKLDLSGKFWSWFQKGNLLLLLVVLYGSIYQVQIDQETMLQGRTATITLAQGILHKLEETGNLDPDAQYCVLGIPSCNSLFEFSKVTEMAGGYARFGSWNSDYSCTRRSWQGVFRHLCGIDLEMCSVTDYGILAEEQAANNMPIFPEEGCILRIDDIIVIRVSD